MYLSALNQFNGQPYSTRLQRTQAVNNVQFAGNNEDPKLTSLTYFLMALDSYGKTTERPKVENALKALYPGFSVKFSNFPYKDNDRAVHLGNPRVDDGVMKADLFLGKDSIGHYQSDLSQNIDFTFSKQEVIIDSLSSDQVTFKNQQGEQRTVYFDWLDSISVK